MEGKPRKDDAEDVNSGLQLILDMQGQGILSGINSREIQEKHRGEGLPEVKEQEWQRPTGVLEAWKEVTGHCSSSVTQCSLDTVVVNVLQRNGTNRLCV